MTEKLILSEIYQLPESLKLKVLHFIVFLKQEYTQKKVEKTKYLLTLLAILYIQNILNFLIKHTLKTIQIQKPLNLPI